MKAETIEHIVQRPGERTREFPLFFQHGAWQGAWCWDRFLEYFSSLGYEAHAISLPGHGKSSMKRGSINRYSLQDYLDCMASEIAKVSPKPVLVGHSMGGAIVQKYLETHSLPGAVLLASVPARGLVGGALRLLRRSPWQAIKTALLMDGYALVETPELAAAHLLSVGTSMDLQDFHFHLVPESIRALISILAPSLHPERVSSPVLVLAGGKDALISLEEGRMTARALNAKFVLFPEQAHNLMMGPEWRQVASVIHSWVTKELQQGVFDPGVLSLCSSPNRHSLDGGPTP